MCIVTSLSLSPDICLNAHMTLAGVTPLLPNAILRSHHRTTTSGPRFGHTFRTLSVSVHRHRALAVYVPDWFDVPSESIAKLCFQFC